MKILLNFFLFVGIFASCEQLANEAEVTRADLDKQLAEINNFIATATCSSEGECRYIAYGSKACGGPQGYLLYPEGVDEEKLKKMIAKYSEDEDNYNKINGIISDCSLPNPPAKIGCEDGNCIPVQ